MEDGPDGPSLGRLTIAPGEPPLEKKYAQGAQRIKAPTALAIPPLRRSRCALLWGGDAG